MLTYAAIDTPEVVHGKGRVQREESLSWQDRGGRV
jgi:hypothetical protein